MATTAIWDVKGWLGKILIYAENPEKTENPKVYDKEDLTDEQRQGLGDVISYAMREEATISEEIKEQFVTGVNCSPNTARAEMLAVKKRFGKNDGIVAFHGYQSFAENEVTPELAHEIGVRLANELWGNRFQVIVATHLDKKNHLHNHFVLNSVSFLDGYRYNDCTKTYMEMRKASDRLCREYGLSVIDNPKRGKSKHYGEWKAEQDGRPTWRGIIKNDIDEAIATSLTDKQFFYKLREKGYFIKQGKDITVRPAGKQRGIKLARNFGEEYTYGAICQRIMANDIPTRLGHTQNKKTVRVFHYKGDIKNQRKIGGLRGRYIYYCFKLGIFPKGQTISPARLHFLLREDIARMEQINKETRLLCKHKIDTSEQLFDYQENRQNKINQLTKYRTHLRYQLRRKTITPEEKEELKLKISCITKEIGKLREEVVLCDDIAKRSEVIKEKIKIIREDENKEVKNNEHRGRSSRSGY